MKPSRDKEQGTGLKMEDVFSKSLRVLFSQKPSHQAWWLSLVLILYFILAKIRDVYHRETDSQECQKLKESNMISVYICCVYVLTYTYVSMCGETRGTYWASSITLYFIFWYKVFHLFSNTGWPANSGDSPFCHQLGTEYLTTTHGKQFIDSISPILWWHIFKSKKMSAIVTCSFSPRAQKAEACGSL